MAFCLMRTGIRNQNHPKATGSGIDQGDGGIILAVFFGSFLRQKWLHAVE